MIRFAEVFAEYEIVQALTAQLGWTHFPQIIYLENSVQRDFYAEMCRMEALEHPHARPKNQVDAV